MFYFVYEWSETLWTYWQCLIDWNAQKENTGSTIRFCNLTSSIEITYMPVAIEPSREPRRYGKHKIYHIKLQEVRKQSFGSDSWCNWWSKFLKSWLTGRLQGITGSFYFSWINTKAKNEPVFSMYNLLLTENFISVWHFEHLTHCPSLTCLNL